MTPESTIDDTFTKIASVDEIPKGDGIGVEVNGIEIAIGGDAVLRHGTSMSNW